MSLLFKRIQYAKNLILTERYGKNTWADDPFTFMGNIQPLTAPEIVAKTEGRISTGMVRVFSESKLQISLEWDSPEAGKGTYVQFKGFWYECYHEINWDSGFTQFRELDHYEYMAEIREKIIV